MPLPLISIFTPFIAALRPTDWACALRCGAVAALMAVGLSQPQTASAQDATPAVLLELFTSQGCSACPPADKMMHDLAARDDVIALALHVDYWDYIGWKDTFASPAFTERQKSYALAHGQRHVYTPQLIVGGKSVIVGAKPMKLGEAIMAHSAAGPAVAMRARRDGDRLTITAPALSDPPGGMMVVDVVRFLPMAEVAVTRGENAGRTLRHANVVTKWTRAASWGGREPLSLTVSLEGNDPVVIILQPEDLGPVLSALRIQ